MSIFNKTNKYNLAQLRKAKRKFSRELQEDTSSLEADILTNSADILVNTNDIATNTADIATNTGDISTNVGDIATNTGDISTNAGDISTNSTDIASNALNITILQNRQTIIQESTSIDIIGADVTNNSTVTYVATNILSALITPVAYATSTFEVEAVATFGNDVNQTGVKVKLEYSTNGGILWADMPNSPHAIVRNVSGSANQRWNVKVRSTISSLTNNDYKFRVSFVAFTAGGYNANYLGSQVLGIITVKEIK